MKYLRFPSDNPYLDFIFNDKKWTHIVRDNFDNESCLMALSKGPIWRPDYHNATIYSVLGKYYPISLIFNTELMKLLVE